MRRIAEVLILVFSCISKFNTIHDAKEESYEIGYIQTSVIVILTRIYSMRRL